MHSSDIDLLFPSRAIDSLLGLRSDGWEKLVNKIIALEAIHPDRIAFVLMMVKLSGCTSCQSDSFRAMRGCVICSKTTIKRYKGSDQSLVDLYDEAKIEVSKYLIEV